MHRQTTRHLIKDRSDCIQETLRILGDKWTALILFQLRNADATFSQLEVSLEGISPRTLSQRLDKLEAEKIIVKRRYCEHPPRFRYHITDKGQELQSVLRKMADWGDKYTTN